MPNAYITKQQQKYTGKADYQGNHDVFKMPSELEPHRTVKPLPLKKIGLYIIGGTLLIIAILTVLSIYQHSQSLL